MKVYISVDIEGISGVVHWQQTGFHGDDYERARRLMTGEANAAIQGAFDGGAEEVVINDGHGSARNLLVEELHPDAKLITGPSVSKPLTQMEGIDETFDVVFLVGYHSQAGSRGVLNHTISGRSVARIELNGTPVGETGMNAGIAGSMGVPVGLVTGDSTVCEEARLLNTGITTVAVKEPIGRYAARCLSPQRAREAVCAGARLAMSLVGKLRPVTWETPTTARLQFTNTSMADVSELIPDVRRVDPLTVEYTGRDCAAAFRVIRACIFLAQATGM